MIRFILVLLSPSQFTYGSAFSAYEIKSAEKYKRSMLEDDPCLDAEQVDSLESVEFLPRYVNLNRPWLRDNITPKIFTSNGLRYQWTWAKSLAIRGLQNDTTVDDVLRYLDDHNCLFLATGHAVWQSVQMARPVSIEGETSCSIPYVYSICVQKYGLNACSLYRKDGNDHQYFIKIGDAKSNRSIHQLCAEPLMLYEWGSTLGLPSVRWSYTVMVMAIYDNSAGQVYLVDMTGRGYADICGKNLAAAVDSTKWQEWADDDLSKAYQFYLLRSMGFGISNHDLQDFVNAIIESKHTKKAAQTFYCESILHGMLSWADENSTTTCHLIYPENPDRKQITRAREIMQNEMAGHWQHVMTDVIDEMEVVYLTERQFIDVQNRIKGRISREESEGWSTHFKWVNEVRSREVQQDDNTSLSTEAGLISFPTSSVETRTSTVAIEKSSNSSEEDSPSDVSLQLSPHSHSADIVLLRSILASAILPGFWYIC